MENILSSVRMILETTPMRWKELVQKVDRDLFTRTPAEGEWSALECLQHIVDTEHVFQVRIQAFLKGEDFPGFNPNTQGTRTRAERKLETLAEEFADLRSESLKMLARLQTSDLQRKARHGELGPVTMSEMIHEWAAHDLNHTVQAERALMQPFIQGSGPWQKFFTDHVIAKK